MDYLEKFQAMIDAYNAGSLNAEQFFRQLVDFARSLNEEELALFDLLTRPRIEMSLHDFPRSVLTRLQSMIISAFPEYAGLCEAIPGSIFPPSSCPPF